MGVRFRSIRVVVAVVLLGALLAPAGAGAQQLDPRAVGSDPSDASLASLSLTGAELGFDPAETQYWVAYGAPTAHPTIEAVASEPGAQIAFSPADADPDTAGYQVATSGLQVVRVNVTSPDGTARRSHVLWLFDYRLRSLGLEGHDIGFDRLVADYAVTVPNDVDTVTVTADGGAHTLAYGSPDADPDTDGHQASLEVGVNEITVTATPKPTRVIATPQTYTIAVTRAVSPELDASLLSLALSGATLSFDAATLSYDVDFVSAADHTTITAAAQPGATVDISPADADATAPGHQVAITSGAATAVAVTVTAADTTTTKAYRVNIADARLRGLAVTGHDIGFDPATTSYSLSVPYGTETVTVGTGTESNSELAIAYSPADADTASGHQIDLAEGANTVTATVTLKGGTDSQTYTITVTRAAATTTDATLKSLALAGAAVDFDAETTSYGVDFVSAADHTTITAAASRTGATVDISPADADATAPGHQIAITSGAVTAVTVTVTAEDTTTTQTYRLNISDARLRGLNISGHDIGYDPATPSYELTVPHSTETLTVSTGTEPNAKLDIAYSPADADALAGGHQVDLSVGANTITVTATLKGGTDTQTYTITVTRGADLSMASLSSLTLSGATFSFDVATLSYDVGFVSAADHTTITAAAAQSGASVEISPADADTETTGHQVAITSGAATVVTVKVTAQDPTITQTYRLNVSDARLRGLAVSGYDIRFDPATASYTLRVPHSVETVTVGTGTEPNAKLDIDYSPADADSATPGHQVDLSVGENTVTVTATLKGGVDSQSYTVTVNRALSGDATLSSLTLTGATIDFDPATTSYAVMYVTAADFATLAATATHPDATVRIDVDDDADTAGHQVRIVTDHTVNITVTAANGVTTKRYQVSVWNVRLQGLAVVGYDIGFDPATASYSLSVPHSVDSVTVGTGSESNPKLDIVYGPADADTATRGHQIDLSEGANTITAAVTLTGGTDTQTYTVTVTRAAAATDARLASLEIDPGFLRYDRFSTTHTAYILPTTGTVTVTAEATQTAANVEITPADADTVTDGHQIDTTADSVSVTVKVTSADGSATSTHTVTVKHRPGGFVKVDVGYGTACALHLSGRVLCWGRHRVGHWTPPRNGQLASSPAADEVFVDITVGDLGACGVRSDSTFLCWDTSGPWSWIENGNVWSIAHDQRAVCYLNVDRHLICGWPWDRQIPAEKQYQSLAITRNYVCATDFDQQVDCFGDDPSDSPDGDFVAIDGGAGMTNHFCGIKTDGSATCWAYVKWRGEYGYAARGNRTGPYIDVSVSRLNYCGIKSDNSVECWRGGGNRPSSSFDYEALSAHSELFMCGLTTGGEIKCGGGSGELGSYAPVSGDASLAGVSFSGLSLSFDPATTDYVVDMAHDKTSTTVTATTRRPAKTVLVEPADADPNTRGHQVDLVGDSVTVTVTVTSFDGAVATYTFEISREAPPDEARLTALSISDVTLSFDDDTYLYRVDVAAGVGSVTVSPTAYHDDATVVVLPADADSNTDGHQVSLTAGATRVITVTVFSADDSQMATYTIAVTRPTS